MNREDSLDDFYRRVASEAGDVHAEKPARPLRLRRVGSVGIRVPLPVPSGLVVPAEVDVLVDLPPGRRGVDLSRQVFTLLGVSTSAAGGLDLARRTSSAVADALPYADGVEVRVRYSGLTFRGPNSSPEPYWAEALVSVGGGRRREELSVTAWGTTACPCTQELLRTALRLRGERPPEPGPTHTQRARATVTLSARELPDVGEENLIGLLERAMSSPVRSALRRPQEARLVEEMLRNPLLAEDAAREILSLCAGLPLPDDVEVAVSIRTQESVHGHEILAEGGGTLGEIRSALGTA